MSPLLGAWHTTQACALTRNRTGDPWVYRPALNPLSHTSQPSFLVFISFCGGVLLKNFLNLCRSLPIFSRTGHPSVLTTHVQRSNEQAYDDRISGMSRTGLFYVYSSSKVLLIKVKALL